MVVVGGQAAQVFVPSPACAAVAATVGNGDAVAVVKDVGDRVALANGVAAAHTAIEEFETQLIVLDDAFQHRQIHRDLSIVLVDATEPFGYGRLLPRGLLREPLPGLRRADVVVLSRADAVDDQQRARIRDRVSQFAGEAAWLEVAHQPHSLLSGDNESSPLQTLHGERVAAFCGIGNPVGFRHTLAECGYDVVAFREFPDHHGYERKDVESIAAWAKDSGATALVCTHKDLVKLQTATLGDVPLRALIIELSVQLPAP